LRDSIKPLLDQASNDVAGDIKGAVDTGFKQLFMARSASDDIEVFENLTNLAVQAAQSGLSNIHLPITILSDLFDVKTLVQCQDFFFLVESRVEVWKDDLFFKSIKNQLLRTCNDLLRRMSRSQNTVFCGRILVFLARFFPLFERSGLNLIGEFNRDNVINLSLSGEEGEDTTLSCTVTSSDPSQTPTPVKDSDLEEGEEAPQKESGSDVSQSSSQKSPKMPVTPTHSTPVIIDYSLYLKFWQLQSFFRNPQTCYDKDQWKAFANNTFNVLNALYSLKLDPTASSEITKVKDQDTVYFAKYLTNQKLLELQLSDSNFRRYILIQLLIVFQYLVANVKFKSETHVLTDGQKTSLRKRLQRFMN